jgi:hypothetical protein
MSLFDCRFAKLNFEYDRERAYREAEALDPLLEWTRSAPGYLGVSLPFSVTENGKHDSDDLMSTKLTWKSMGLTHIPEVPLSKLGRGALRNKMTECKWVWRDDVIAPYLRDLCYGLPFDSVGSVRLIVLPPGNTGSVHNDDPSGLFYVTGARSVTLNLSGGGSQLEFMHNDKHYTISDHPAFLFRDDCYHGVRIADTLRIQMRVNGFFNPKMAELIDTATVLQ